MRTTDVNSAPAADGAQGDLDLGPLAWVLDELRKSLDSAVKAMRRFVRDAETARESDLAALDAGPLRIARQQLHQACGALEMVGMGSPALVLRSMESAVQKFVQRPETCSDDAAAVIERASFALIEYLEAVLAGKAASAVALFPQYRDVQALAGAERVHPADLWPVERRFREPEGAASAEPLAYGPEARAKLDSAVLRIVKTGDVQAALRLRDTCLGFVAAEQDRQSRVFWKICAGFFEALGCGLLPPDVYVKRVASRVLMQYATLARGDTTIADRLVQDLLFYCSQGVPGTSPTDSACPSLLAVRQAFSLDRFKPVDYESARFGRFDPAVLTQARKRIASATETWSALAGGDRNKLKPAVDQFSLVCDSLRKLHPGSENLALSLTRALDATARSGEPPSATLAMEVATSVLYLQAAFEELDTADGQMQARADRLADRLDGVSAGAEPEPLEQWMEELYRRVSDSQTMGSVVDELRSTLGEAEKSLDQFFRNPADTTVLAAVPGHLAQMRGVLSVLGLDQASLAVMRMRDTVERLLIHEVAPADRQPVFEKLGSSLGALGFLIDMLSYQRAMARKLFVYDEDLGELRILTGKARPRASDAIEEVAARLEERAALPLPDVVPRFPVQVPASEPTDFAPFPDVVPLAADETPGVVAPVALLPDHLFDSTPTATPTATAEGSGVEPSQSLAAPIQEMVAPVTAFGAPNIEDELLEVFLEEAHEVVANGLAAIRVLTDEPANLSEQTTLRRAFHTLKGSSRMVGLNDFGEAGWAMEQLLNAWLAEQKPIQPTLLQLSADALRAFDRWADDIAAGRADGWQAQAFSQSAQAMRLEDRLLPIATPGETGTTAPATVPQADATTSFVSHDVLLDGSEPLVPEGFETVEEERVSADFQTTQISDHFAQASAASDMALPQSAEDIDFLAFAAALDDESAKPLVVDTTSADFVLDLELPDLELPDVELPDLEAVAVSDSVPVALLSDDAVQHDDAAHVTPAETAPVFDLMDASQAQEFADFESLLASNDPAPAVSLPLDESTLIVMDSDIHEPIAPQEEIEAHDDAVKVIETLRIGLPLYNVYLNEADEWSRRLVTCMQEWALELHEPVPDVAVAFAHSLAGSSATVGFTALSELARVLEHALQHVQLQSGGTQEQAQAFTAAADDIRRLLHQFAAGFLKEPSQQVLAQLQEVLQAEVANTLSPPEEDDDEPVMHGVEATGDLQPLEAQFSAPEQTHSEQDAVAPADTIEPVSVAVTALNAVGAVAPGHVAPALSVVAHDHSPPPDAAIAAAVDIAPNLDDDIDAVDVIDPDLFPIFDEEAAELLPQLGGALRQWASRPDNMGARNEVLRALHTLKGSSRLAGAMRLGEMTHRLESAIESLDAETVTTHQIEPLQASFDGLQANMEGLRALVQSPAYADAVVSVSDDAERIDAQPIATLVPSAPAMAAPAVAAPVAPAVRLTGPLQMAPLRVAASQSVRVRAQLLDRLVNQAGEVMISRSRLDVRLGQFRSSLTDLSGNLDRLRQQLRDIEVQAESQMQSRLALSKDSAAGFDPLEFDRFTRVQELTRMMAESVNDVATVQRNLQRAMEGAEDDLIAQGRQARELQRDLLRTRMVEFEGIAERLYAVVRQASKETGKQIKLDITGGSIEMDRGVLDRMTPAFEHLLRNCVAHGIEEPHMRAAAGKPASGTITVDLRHEGNDVSVEFRDDGAGLDVLRIKEKALSQGLVAPDAELTDADAANLIFLPGFSTASEVTGLSGRGIGMDVVRAEINALGGRIETSTQAGQGASFRMVLPLTTAVTQVVMLRAGDLAFGVPANVVEIVRRTSATDLEAAYRTGSFDDGTEKVPFFWSGALLQASVRSGEPAGKTRPVVIFRSAAQRIALHVDEVLGNQEVVVKNLGPQLSRLPGLAGMSVLASGAVVLIYNPVALATVYGEQVRVASAGVPQMAHADDASVGGGKAAASMQLAGPSQVPLILVVDDSITVRRVTQRLLQREGYRVALAADGLQALERLQEERPTVVLSDIEMPRMDGFDLARNIRADKVLRDLPIIMITSRIAVKHREHAMELGVNHYLGKPYADEELLSLVQHYARLEAATTEA